jgi:hypothetical protein
LIDPATGSVSMGSLEEGSPFTLHGFAFTPGPVHIAVDSMQGTPIGQVTVGGDGKFTATYTLPLGTIGSHQFVAWQLVGGSTIQTTTPFFSQMIPR